MKKRILTVLITIITVIPLVLVVPKADTQNSSHEVTQYGDYTFQQGMSTTTFDYELTPLAINLTWNSGSYMKLDYNFDNKYSGTIKFTVTSSQNWVLDSSPVYYTVYADGVEATAYISATTTGSEVGKTKTFTVIFTNATGIHFNVATGASATFFNSSCSISISNFSVAAQQDLTDIYTDIHQLKLWWDLYIPGMSTSLSHIDTDLDNINSNIQALSPYIDQLEQYVDGLEGLLTSLQTVSMYHIEPYQHGAWIYASKYDSSFPRWKYGLPYMNYSTTYNSQNYTASHGIRLATGYSYAMMFYSSKALTTSDMTIYYNGTGDVSVSTLPITEINSQLYLMGIIFKNNRNGFSSFDVEFGQSFELYPLYFGLTNNIPDEINALFGREYDNTYTRLLDSINSGISALNSDYDTSQYDQYEQTMDALNDSLRSRFDSRDDNMQSNVNTLFTPAGTAGSDGSIFEKYNFGNINRIYGHILNHIFDAFPAIKYILIFALLLLVIGVMI